MRGEINLTDEEIESQFEALGPGLTAEEVVFTRDTFDDFKAGAKGVMNVFEKGNTLQIDTRKSQIFVIDFGSVRGAHVV